MAHEITVPPFGESITESTVAQWHKKDGDMVQKGEPLVTIDTEKTSSDLQAEASGKLKILVTAGTDVKIGALIGRIEEDSSGSQQAATDDAPQENPPNKEGIEPETSTISPVPLHIAAPQPQPGTAQPAEQVPAAEAKKAEQKHRPPVMPPAGETQSAPIIEIAQPARIESNSNASDQPETREPMSRMRRTIAQHLLRAKNETAMLTSFNEVDMSAVISLRERSQDQFVKKHGVKLGFMSFFVKACIEALREFPLVNASIDGDDVVYHHFYNISVAVSTEKGLVVPVLRDADKKSFADIERELADLATRARTGKLGLDELKGGTFTITNGGVFGSMLSTPLLNPPQVGILGMHNITPRAVVVDGQIMVRPMMYLALSYDHRLVDGKEAVQFLVRVRESIAAPERMLIGL